VAAAVPLHVASPGPNSLKVIDPVGLDPPASTAVSEMLPPTLTGADAVVEIVGVPPPAAVTTTDSPAELHADVAPEFPASPEYAATNRYVPAAAVVNGPDA
jgi:hypothetical protein